MSKSWSPVSTRHSLARLTSSSRPSLALVQPNVVVSSRRTGRVVDVVGVPQPQLAHGRVEPDLEHVARLVGVVAPAAVPDPVMEQHHGPGRAGEPGLTGQVLVATDPGLVDPPQVGARHRQRAALLQGDLARVVHELDVEGVGPGVQDGVTVHVLRLAAAGRPDVDGVVVDHRVRPDQALHGPRPPPAGPAARGRRTPPGTLCPASCRTDAGRCRRPAPRWLVG